MTEGGSAVRAATARHISLDALRGFAVMGILAMNIIGFAMPDMAYFSPAVYGGTEGADMMAWLLSFVLVDGKMRGLFSLLFGASLLLVTDRAEARGESAASVHYNRMFWLALFGLFHFFFIWWGDILFLYAAIGSIAFLFRDWEAERLMKWALVIYATGFILWTTLLGSFFALQTAANAPDADADVISEFDAIITDFGFSDTNIADSLALYGGSYAEILMYRLSELTFDPVATVFQLGLETLPLMLLGMALMKNGFLLGQWEAPRYRHLVKWLLPAGVIISVMLAAVLYIGDFDPVLTLSATVAWSYPPRLMMTLAYAALLIMLINRFADSASMRRVAAAGRAAFTNYLGTSILMTTIFYGYGLGLFGQIGRWEVYLFVFGACVLMLLWSQPWLSRFRYGPLEWLWRSLARRQVQPMRITN